MIDGTLIKPKRLEKGNTIGVVAPSEPIQEEQFNLGIKHMEESGYRVLLGENVRSVRGYMAGTKEQRISDIHSMFANPEVRAIICGAGGSNSNQLIDQLDYKLIESNPKIFMGLSDPTVLLNAIHSQTGLVTFHGPVVQFDMSWNYTPYTFRYMEKALSKDEPIGAIAGLNKSNVLRPGNGRGKLVGGNLTSLQLLLGTRYEPLWDNSILFWEDVFEPVHALDAKLSHFKSAGVLDRISGMVVGELVECVETDYPNSPNIEEVIIEICSGYKFPILYNVKLGHTKDKITIPIGCMAELNTEGIALLSIVESGVCV